MGRYHVLEGRQEGRGARVTNAIVVHVDVPPTQQLPGAALALADFESAVPNIDPVELDEIRGGRVTETRTAGHHAPNAPTSDNMMARVRARFLDVRRRALSEYRVRYKFYLEEHPT